jgi:hypothetical protein
LRARSGHDIVLGKQKYDVRAPRRSVAPFEDTRRCIYNETKRISLSLGALGAVAITREFPCFGGGRCARTWQLETGRRKKQQGLLTRAEARSRSPLDPPQVIYPGRPSPRTSNSKNSLSAQFVEPLVWWSIVRGRGAFEVARGLFMAFLA